MSGSTSRTNRSHGDEPAGRSRPPAARSFLLIAAEAPPERRFRRLGRLLSDRAGPRNEVLGAERHQLCALDVRELGAGDLREPKRLRVQCLLEQRPGEARVAEALAALRCREDPPYRVDGAL